MMKGIPVLWFCLLVVNCSEGMVRSMSSSSLHQEKVPPRAEPTSKVCDHLSLETVRLCLIDADWQVTHREPLEGERGCVYLLERPRTQDGKPAVGQIIFEFEDAGPDAERRFWSLVGEERVWVEPERRKVVFQRNYDHFPMGLGKAAAWASTRNQLTVFDGGRLFHIRLSATALAEPEVVAVSLAQAFLDAESEVPTGAAGIVAD